MESNIGRTTVAVLTSLLALGLATPAWSQSRPEAEAVDEPLSSAADSGSTATAATTAGAEESGQAPSPAEAVENELYGKRRAQVRNRGALNDRQGPAPRPGDYVLDPEFRGFIQVPNTVVLMKLNARPRIDMMATSAASDAEFRFVPSQFRVPGDEGYADEWRFRGNANGSQIRLDFQAPTVPGNLRLFYQNDFYGSDTKHMNYRLQHLYGQFHGLVAGFTFGLFENPDAWPDTVDYEGPNSVIFARRALVHYQMAFGDDWELTFGLENPEIYVDLSTAATPAANQARSKGPDGGFNVRWTPGDLGHVQLSTIFRSVGVDGDDVGSQDAFGWGVNLSGVIDASESDTVQYWFVYGQGVGGMGNDTSFLAADAALDTAGNLVVLDYWSAMGAITHHWTPRWRSTLTYGYVNLETTDAQAGGYEASHYGTANVIYQLFKRMSLGVEGMYGRKEVRGGAAADVFRVQASLAFSVFD